MLRRRASLSQAKMDSLDSNSGEEVENNQMEDPCTLPASKHPTIELQENEFWPLSGKPYFHVILSKSHVASSYQLVIPAKLQSVIPSLVIPVHVIYKGKKWKMSYHGENLYCKKFDSHWKAFVIDNNLKVGDACVFELMKCSSKILKFRVQILRGDFPYDNIEKATGESVDTPIVVE